MDFPAPFGPNRPVMPGRMASDRPPKTCRRPLAEDDVVAFCDDMIHDASLLLGVSGCQPSQSTWLLVKPFRLESSAAPLLSEAFP